MKAQEIQSFFLAMTKKKPFKSAHDFRRVLSNYSGMTRTVLLYCPVSAEIRTVDSQSDLRILS